MNLGGHINNDKDKANEEVYNCKNKQAHPAKISLLLMWYKRKMDDSKNNVDKHTMAASALTEKTPLHLYKRSCPSVGPSVGPSVRPSVCPVFFSDAY